MRKRVKRAIESLRRQRQRVFRRIADATRKLANLRERFPGDRRKAEKRRTKQKIKHRKETKEELTARIERKKKWLEEHDDPKPPSSGVGTFDGKPVAAWIIPWLQRSRENGWGGVLVSGYRSPEYSQSLCYAICGAPSCPGRCAGLSSNHTRHVYPEGAVDVSDYYTFASVQKRIDSPLFNALGAQDPVHFSTSGR